MDQLVIVNVLLVAALVSVLVSVLMRSDDRTRIDRRLRTIEHRLQVLTDHLGIVEPEPTMPEVVGHLESGKKIEAIKVYREATGAGLKEAKDAVEEMARRRGL